MSKVWIFIFALLAVSYGAESQNFNKIYNENIKARGGKDNISNIQTYVYSGKITRDDTVSFNFKVGYKLPNKYRIELYSDGDTLAFINDGVKSYALMPQINGSAFEIPNDKMLEMYNQMIVPFVFLDASLDKYKTEKYKFNISAKDSIDSIPQFKLICSKKDEADIVFVSQADSLISRITSSYTINGKKIPAVIDLKNYEPVGEFKKPKLIKIYNGANTALLMEIESFEINKEIPDEVLSVELYK